MTLMHLFAFFLFFCILFYLSIPSLFWTDFDLWEADIMFPLARDGMAVRTWLVTWAPQGGKFWKCLSKTGRETGAHFRMWHSLFVVFCPNRCDCTPLPPTGRVQVCTMVPSLTASRWLPWQLSCVIETFQHEICFFFSLNFKQNFKCQVSEAEWGY